MHRVCCCQHPIQPPQLDQRARFRWFQSTDVDFNKSADTFSINVTTWGYVFNRARVTLDESIVSIPCKFARLNAIAGSVVVSLAARKKIDPYEGVAFTPEHIYVERLANTFHLSTRVLGIALASKVDPMRMSSQLRWCPACMREG